MGGKVRYRDLNAVPVVADANEGTCYSFTTVTPVVVRVPDDYETIQAGINVACEGDTVLVAPGTYTGQHNRDIDFLGKNLVLLSEGGPEVTIVDCQATESDRHRGFFVHRGSRAMH